MWRSPKELKRLSFYLLLSDAPVYVANWQSNSWDKLGRMIGQAIEISGATFQTRQKP
jgi:hypothetical protein